jgi:hypothetical protein
LLLAAFHYHHPSAPRRRQLLLTNGKEKGGIFGCRLFQTVNTSKKRVKSAFVTYSGKGLEFTEI